MISPPEFLVDRATREVGSADFGPDGWQEGLGRLVAAIDNHVAHDGDAVPLLEDLIVARLCRRLRIEAWCGSHPEFDRASVDGPLLIVGLPRTGTTALHYLLATDPRFRYTRNWELDDPVPPPEATAEETDPRRTAGAPAANVRHIRTVDGPAEDGRIHELTFRTGELILPVPSFTRWWRSTDHRVSFAYHERVLRLLHSRRPPTLWLLKNPAYLFQLELVLAQYPGARFVVTHRDPADVLPSTCSTVLASRSRRLPDWRSDAKELGWEVLEHFVDGVRRARVARRNLPTERFLDVGQKEIENDPVGVAERVYEFAGLRIDPQVRHDMNRWADDNRRGARGDHVYHAEDYGLTAEGIRAEFRDYLEDYAQFC